MPWGLAWTEELSSKP